MRRSSTLMIAALLASSVAIPAFAALEPVGSVGFSRMDTHEGLRRGCGRLRKSGGAGNGNEECQSEKLCAQGFPPITDPSLSIKAFRPATKGSIHALVAFAHRCSLRKKQTGAPV